MTSNQIAFYKAKEEAEHWKRQDKLQKKQNKIAGRQAKETARHNVATEALTREELGIKDWYNRANIGLGYENAAINRSHYQYSDQTTKEHYQRQDAINQAHYEASDATNRALGQIQNDKLLLDYVNTFGQPIEGYTLDATGKKVSNSGKYISTADYFQDGKVGMSFETTPITLQYLTPAAIGNYGRTIAAVSTVVNTIGNLTGLTNRK